MTNKIKSFEDACKVLKIKKALPDVSALPKKHQIAITAHYKLVIIIEALNEGWKPNWNDYNENKYYCWFEYKKGSSGFGFSAYVYVCDDSDAAVGSRLVFKNRELAEYAGKKFQKLYSQYFMLK